MALDAQYNSDVSFSVEVGFVSAPLSSAPTWVNITTDVRQVKIIRGRNNHLDQFRPGTLNLVLDNQSGNYDPTDTGSVHTPNVRPMKQVRVRAGFSGTTFDLFRGNVESWPMQPLGLGAVELAKVKAVDGFKLLNLVQDSSTAASQKAHLRIGSFLTAAGWSTSLRNLSTGGVTIAAYTPACEYILPLIQQIEAAEAGQFYIAADGNATFRERTYRTGLATQGTFGDGSTEIPYQGIKTDYDDTQIWNRIEVFVAGLPSQSDSTASQDDYGVRHLLVNDILLPGTTEADDLAVALRDRYKDPHERIEQIMLKPEHTPTTQWPQVLGRDLSDEILVKYRTNGGSTKSAVSYIEGIGHTITMNPRRRWETKWNLSQYT